MKDFYLKEIVYPDHEKQPISTWQFEQVNDAIRLYYKPFIGQQWKGDKNGFAFYAVEWVSSETEHYVWDLETVAVECLFHGVAYWDGLRHLYMGDEQTENFGYHYYPNTVDHVECLIALKELEYRFCKEFEPRKWKPVTV